MNNEASQERAPNPNKLDYIKLVDAIRYLVDNGFSETDNLHHIRQEILFSLRHANPDSDETNSLLDAMNAIDSILREIENPR